MGALKIARKMLSLYKKSLYELNCQHLINLGYIGAVSLNVAKNHLLQYVCIEVRSCKCAVIQEHLL